MAMKDQTVVITGATAGIGRAVALQLASLGANLVVTGRDAHRGRATEEALRRAESERSLFVPVDRSMR